MIELFSAGNVMPESIIRPCPFYSSVLTHYDTTTRPGVSDAFVTKFNPSGSVVYSTYLGGSNSERGSGIAIDTEGNAYATGGNGDAYVTKINAAGSAFVYSTSLGGNNEDHGFDVAVDSSGNAYVAGYTKSTNFPTVNPAQPASGGGAFEGFIAKISDVPPNQSPLAMCKGVTKAADSNNQATVTPEEIDDGSSDPDNDPLTLTLNPAGPFPLGTTAVILTVDDNHQGSDTCTAIVPGKPQHRRQCL